jgi:hypothetical protein
MLNRLLYSCAAVLSLVICSPCNAMTQVLITGSPPFEEVEYDSVSFVADSPFTAISISGYVDVYYDFAHHKFGNPLSMDLGNLDLSQEGSTTNLFLTDPAGPFYDGGFSLTGYSRVGPTVEFETQVVPTVPGQTYNLSFEDVAFGDPDYAFWGYTVSIVPETGTWVMLLIGSALIGCSQRRRRSGMPSFA